jgi:hypothetical protein
LTIGQFTPSPRRQREGFGAGRIQALVHNVEKVPLAALHPDHANCHVVRHGCILERAIDRNDRPIKVFGQFLVRLAGSRINAAIEADFAT